MRLTHKNRFEYYRCAAMLQACDGQYLTGIDLERVFGNKLPTQQRLKRLRAAGLIRSVRFCDFHPGARSRFKLYITTPRGQAWRMFKEQEIHQL